MRMDVNLTQRLEQRMHLSQQMLQNLELLQLPIMDLRDLIMQELEENPTLEERRDVDDPEATPDPDEIVDKVDTSEAEIAKREALESLEDEWSEIDRRTRRSDSAEAAERRMEMMNNYCAASTSLREHLTSQLSLLEIEDEVRPYCEHVIQTMDDSGYIPLPLEELVSSLPEELKREPPEVLLRKVERAIAILQGLEPRGVGARSVKECLLLQLDVGNPEYPLLCKLIENHFEDVGANRLPRIVKAFSADPEVLAMLGYKGEPDPNLVLEDVKALIASMSKLNPKPGATFSADRVPKVYPEVLIKEVNGNYEIVLEDGWLPPIAVNRNYEEMVEVRKLSAAEKQQVSAMAGDGRFSKQEHEVLAEIARGKRIMPGDRTKFTEMAKKEGLSSNEQKLLENLALDPTFNRDDRNFIKSRMDAGRKLITAIEQRRNTISRITSEILKRQMDFFESGVEHLKPLKMQEVADAVGIHLSTVSRAISEKWVETPRGIFPLKFFFASAAPRSETAPTTGFDPVSGNGGGGEPQDEQTRLALMEKIREIIGAEDKKNPLSDLEIVRRLKDQHHITAARRTIAKYREEMGIPSSRLRKQY